MSARAWSIGFMFALVLSSATACGSVDDPAGQPRTDTSTKSGRSPAPEGDGQPDPSASSPAWQALAGNDHRFYVALDGEQNLAVAYITPAGHYCVDNRASVAFLKDASNPASVMDPQALWEYSLARDEGDTWMTSGDKCTAVMTDGEYASTTLNDQGLIKGGNSTDSWTLQVLPTTDGMSVTTVSTTNPAVATVGRVREFVAVDR